MKRYLTPILLLLWSAGATLFAQQAPQYSMYMLNPYAFNPAYAGLENTLIATGVYRQQWSGLKGAPVAMHANAHLPLYFISSGAGLKVENQTIGAHRITSAMLSFNYQLELSRTVLLSGGISAGYLQYALDGDKLRAPQGTYVEPGGVFTHNDQFLPEGKISTGTPVFEAGIYLKAQRLELGIAVQPAVAPALSADDGFRLQPIQHYLLSAGYSISAGEDLLITPSVFVKSDITETQSEISATVRWRENIFAGASFRGIGKTAKDAVSIFGGLRLNEKTTLGYAFDIPLSPLNAVNRGSHELLLRYSLNKPIGAGKLPAVIYNPRFL